MDDEVGNEAARLLNELIGGGKELTATVMAGQFSSKQAVQVGPAELSNKGPTYPQHNGGEKSLLQRVVAISVHSNILSSSHLF